MLHGAWSTGGDSIRREVTTIADTDALEVETREQPGGPPDPFSHGGLPPAHWQPSPANRVRSWIRLRLRSADERRLDALRTKFARQLARRDEAARQAGQTAGTWGEAADALLSEAGAALRRSDVDTAWSCLEEALRMDVFAYDPTELAAARMALAAEATEGLRVWRSEAITRLLAAPDEEFCSRLAKLVPDEAVRGKVDTLCAPQASPQARDQGVIDHLTGVLKDAKVSRPAETAKAIEGLAAEREQARKTTLYAAMGLRDEDSVEEAQRLSRLHRHLLAIGGILGLALVQLLVLAMSAPIGLLAKPDDAGHVLWAYVALFGTLGGGLSAFRSISGRGRLRLPPHLLHVLLTAARPLLGAIAALAAFVLLQSGALAFRPATTAAILLVAFLAGFTERLVVRTVEPFQVPEEPAPPPSNEP